MAYNLAAVCSERHQGGDGKKVNDARVGSAAERIAPGSPRSQAYEDDFDSAFDTASLCEAQGGRGALPWSIKPIDSAFRLRGPAFPVRCAPRNNLCVHRAVYEAPRGSVLVVDVGGAREAGYWGEILTGAALAQGLVGLVIDGGVRDADRIAATQFPVFCTGLSIQGTAKDEINAGTLGQPIQIGEVSVEQGDLIVGDRDGVVVIPKGSIDGVLRAARERVAREQNILQRIRDGESTMAIYKFSPT
jgi:4-hydroxy-4-methyl-2-oxoglutarate aldolase